MNKLSNSINSVSPRPAFVTLPSLKAQKHTTQKKKHHERPSQKHEVLLSQISPRLNNIY
jgi:hypothetical protein